LPSKSFVSDSFKRLAQIFVTARIDGAEKNERERGEIFLGASWTHMRERNINDASYKYGQARKRDKRL
jgi:hypothetical protein